VTITFISRFFGRIARKKMYLGVKKPNPKLYLDILKGVSHEILRAFF
jgi:hypothetical protein